MNIDDMLGLDGFWSVIDKQLEQARSAKTADDVLRIFAIDEHNSPAFFAGSGGDDRLDEALFAAGWGYAWARASYHWAMTAPDGSGITYVEGDIFPGVQRPVI